MENETDAAETAEVNGQQVTLEEFMARCEAHAETARRFYANEPVECADLDLSLVAALIDAKFPEVDQPFIVLSQEDFTMLLTGGIQIGYTLARRVDAGTLNAEAEDGEAADEEASE